MAQHRQLNRLTTDLPASIVHEKFQCQRLLGHEKARVGGRSDPRGSHNFLDTVSAFLKVFSHLLAGEGPRKRSGVLSSRARLPRNDRSDEKRGFGRKGRSLAMADLGEAESVRMNGAKTLEAALGGFEFGEAAALLLDEEVLDAADAFGGS